MSNASQPETQAPHTIDPRVRIGHVHLKVADLQRQTGIALESYSRVYGALGRVVNARVAADAEAYYRSMFRGRVSSWNLRDCHMADTLDRLLEHHGPNAKGIVWEHNTHIGDARATDMEGAGMVNIPTLKGVHYAIESGRLAAEAAFAALKQDVESPPVSALSRSSTGDRRAGAGSPLSECQVNAAPGASPAGLTSAASVSSRAGIAASTAHRASGPVACRS